jgi:hypothetical protein
MRLIIVALTVILWGCTYNDLVNPVKKQIIIPPSTVPFTGTWAVVRTTTASCTNAALNGTFINSGFNSEIWFIGIDSLGVTSHGTLTTPYAYTINGNTLCLKNGGLSPCYTFIQVNDTLTLISQPDVPEKSCVTESVLKKLK